MKKGCFLLALAAYSYGYCQDLPLSTQQQLEDQAQSHQTEWQQEDGFFQQLDYLSKHPININTATADELKVFSFLSVAQINNLLSYRKLTGKLIDIYELQAVPGWDLLTIHRILPFVMAGATESIQDHFLSRFRGEHSFSVQFGRTLEKARGYDTKLANHFLGDPDHVTLRYHYQYKNLLQYGFLADKDAGEPLLKSTSSEGFDFYSFHFFLRRFGIWKALAIGDFTVNMGQGLIQWQALAFSKTAATMNINRQAEVLLPYRSASEYNFNRGIGATLQKGRWEATFFASARKVSGNVVNDTTDFFSGFYTSGLHRTASEQADRNKIRMISAGGNLNYQQGAFKLGLNTVKYWFSLPLNRSNVPYNYYALTGTDVWNSSLDFHYTYKNVYVFGEGAINKESHKAMLAGLIASVDPKVDVSVLYRDIQPVYQTVAGDAFTESATPTNEKGLYAGIAIRPNPFWQFNAYADVYRFPWLRYRINAPANGSDYLAHLSYHPDKKVEIYLQYRQEHKPVNSAGDRVLRYPEDGIKKDLRLQLSDQISRKVLIRSRVEILGYQQEGSVMEQGFTGILDCNYQVLKWVRTGLRFQYFETGSYNSRIYVYESAVMSGFSTPSFYGKGIRYYWNVGLKGKHWQGVFRWAQTIYRDRTSVGSGLDETNGNKRSSIELKLEYSL